MESSDGDSNPIENLKKLRSQSLILSMYNPEKKIGEITKEVSS